MTGFCTDRVVLITGAGRGIGRSHALQLAAEGAKIVVNDPGRNVDGSGDTHGVADEVVAEIRAAGGEAVASYDDISDFDAAGQAVQTALDTFGDLHVVVNNAGILRDRMLVNMSIDEWDAIARVHLRGTFGPTRHAAAYWRDRSKAGNPVEARVINTSSPSGLYGNVGQTNYGAAKAGIAAFTVIAAAELGRYGVTVNAIAPAAITRMTADLNIQLDGEPLATNDALPAERISPLIVYLASTRSGAVSGRVFNIWGDHISIAEGWHAGPAADNAGGWTPELLDEVLPAPHRRRSTAG